MLLRGAEDTTKTHPNSKVSLLLNWSVLLDRRASERRVDRKNGGSDWADQGKRERGVGFTNGKRGHPEVKCLNDLLICCHIGVSWKRRRRSDGDGVGVGDLDLQGQVLPVCAHHFAFLLLAFGFRAVFCMSRSSCTDRGGLHTSHTPLTSLISRPHTPRLAAAFVRPMPLPTRPNVHLPRCPPPTPRSLYTHQITPAPLRFFTPARRGPAPPPAP